MYVGGATARAVDVDTLHFAKRALSRLREREPMMSERLARALSCKESHCSGGRGVSGVNSLLNEESQTKQVASYVKALKRPEVTYMSCLVAAEGIDCLQLNPRYIVTKSFRSHDIT
jgi:hypothetical protein